MAHSTRSARDGQWIAFAPWTREFHTWNRYEGGTAADIWLFNLKTHESKKITDCPEPTTCRCSTATASSTLGRRAGAPPQHLGLQHEGRQPQAGDGLQGCRDEVAQHRATDIVLENGGVLYLLPLDTLTPPRDQVSLPGDRPHLRPKSVDVGGNLSSIGISPQAKRAVVDLRGDVWTLPAKDGFARNLTATDNINERDPAGAPTANGSSTSATANGEYDLYLRPRMARRGEAPTSDATCFRYNPHFSPDSKKIAYTDKTAACTSLSSTAAKRSRSTRTPGAAAPAAAGRPTATGWPTRSPTT